MTVGLHRCQVFQQALLLAADHYHAVCRSADVHVLLQTRMKKLEQVRLEVDSRRHTVSQLAQKIEKQRAKLTAAGDRAKSEENIEATIRRMQHKENKLAGMRFS